MRNFQICRSIYLAISFVVFLLSSNLEAKDADLYLYSRPGCPHCESAKAYLNEFKIRHPHIRVHIYDIWSDVSRMRELQEYAKEKRITQIAVPIFRGVNGYLIGFDMNQELEQKLLGLVGQGTINKSHPLISLPLVGQVKISDYTPLALTAMLGLLDGLNPCAMWVLLILLSLLIHLKKRSRILLVASVFVIVSGIIYFLFMSSLLAFYDYIGMSRAVQIIVGCLALVIGSIHVKDFFWFKEGISLSIPDKLKTQIGEKAAGIIRAESIWLALGSAATLAVFVNFVELLCTAGIPAIYTQVLAQNNILGSERILYLILYTLFYMLDDSIMVFLAVWTLSQTRLQEKSGRWLKLLSGMVLFVLSILMIFFPRALNFL